MIDLSRKCIFSGSTNNLNTIMEITLDGEKYKVAVSEEHEDNANPVAIKKLIPDRLAEIEKEKAEIREKMEIFKELAEEMGFALVKKEDLEQMQITRKESADPNALADNPTIEVGGSQFIMQKNTRQNQITEGMTREEAEAAIEAAKRIGARTQGDESATLGEAAPEPQYQIPEQITISAQNSEKIVKRPKPGAKKMQTVKGAAGLPTAIPRSLHGADGETTISIVDTGGNKTIQMRGKQLAQMREYGDESFYSRPCRPCRGIGFHGKKECRACGGAGIVI